jgi:hypothetical protein
LNVGTTFPSAPGRLYSFCRRIFPRVFENAFASFSFVNVLNFRRPFLKEPTRYFVIVYRVRPPSLLGLELRDPRHRQTAFLKVRR